jgi:hypothetical protein
MNITASSVYDNRTMKMKMEQYREESSDSCHDRSCIATYSFRVYVAGTLDDTLSNLHDRNRFKLRRNFFLGRSFWNARTSSRSICFAARMVTLIITCEILQLLMNVLIIILNYPT